MCLAIAQIAGVEISNMLVKTEEITTMPLFLSHWDATVPVFIPVNVLEDLKNHHLMGVRYLNDCFRKNVSSITSKTSLCFYILNKLNTISF